MILIEAAITLTWGLIEMSKLQEHPTFKEIDGEFDLDQFEMGLAPPKAILTLLEVSKYSLKRLQASTSLVLTILQRMTTLDSSPLLYFSAFLLSLSTASRNKP